MATLAGVAVLFGTGAGAAELGRLGVDLRGVEAADRGVFVVVDGGDIRRVEMLAAKLSSVPGTAAFSVLAQTSADVYVLGEWVAGSLQRRIQFGMDEGGWLAPIGPPRAWETDFHFARPVDELVDYLSDDDDWSDDDLAAARRAYENRRIDWLPRLPVPNGSQMFAFLSGLGIRLPAQ
jgi:hypothetical protein